MGKAPARPARPARIDTVVTFLEMKRPPDGKPPEAPVDGVTVDLEEAPSVEFYRHLYDTVGAPWLWYERRLLDDQALAATIGDPAVEIYVLRVEGAVAGYSELDRRAPPDIDIAYFGLVPEFIGRRLGTYLLDWTVARAPGRAVRLGSSSTPAPSITPRRSPSTRALASRATRSRRAASTIPARRG